MNGRRQPGHLAVILVAEAAAIRVRLRTRGASHGRFEDTDGIDVDLGYYADAADLLAPRGVDVLTIDVDQHRPCDTVRVISAAIRTR